MASATKARFDDIWPIFGQQRPKKMTTGAREAILSLLASRPPDATICPSEVARAIAPGDNWRDAMSAVHAAIDRLINEEAVRLNWKGKDLATRAGPYRISRASKDRSTHLLEPMNRRPQPKIST